MPLIHALGFSNKKPNRVIRNKTFDHPYVKVGARKRQLQSTPDYLFERNGKFVALLDAKAPNEQIGDGEHRQQAYFYAIHPEIHVGVYGLCNGREIAIYRTTDTNPALFFHLSDLRENWDKLTSILSPRDEMEEAPEVQPVALQSNSTEDSFYLARPLLQEIAVRKQQARRHFRSTRMFHKAGMECGTGVHSKLFHGQETSCSTLLEEAELQLSKHWSWKRKYSCRYQPSVGVLG
ncbi:MAG: hypothetical protein IPH10_13340 [bacterium]|nr:hypothetical protein [bacterium]